MGHEFGIEGRLLEKLDRIFSRLPMEPSKSMVKRVDLRGSVGILEKKFRGHRNSCM